MELSKKGNQSALSGFQRILEAGLIISSIFSVFILLALVTFDPADPGWSQTGATQNIQNAGGAAGAWLADSLLFIFGWLAFLIPFVFAFVGWLLFKRFHNLAQIDYLTLGLKLIGVILTLCGAAAICSINFDDITHFSSGGVVGDIVSSAMLPNFNFVGTTLLLLCFLLTGITLMTGVSWLTLIDELGNFVVQLFINIKNLKEKFSNESEHDEHDPLFSTTKQAQIGEETNSPLHNTETQVPPNKPFIDLVDEPVKTSQYLDVEDIADQTLSFTAVDDQVSDDDIESALHNLKETHQSSVNITAEKTIIDSPHDYLLDDEPVPSNGAHLQPQANLSEANNQFFDVDQPIANDVTQPAMAPLPSIDLLDRPDKQENPISREELEQVSRLVELKLLDFNVEAKVVGVYPGPVITRFELDLAPGIKVSKITGLSKDLARALSAISVRVVEVIPGKSFIGLELPNKHREIVRLSEVIACENFVNSASPLTMVLGSDISGKPVVVDLAKMPHLLVAGTTGSGKSVGVNTMILSLLYKSGPEDVRLIMIDPKMLELSVYEGIPHLLTEVITDMKEAANGLRWCVGEMERRYKLMSALGVRNLKGFNTKVEEAKKNGSPIIDPLWKPSDSMAEEAPFLDKLPAIVVIIDEFADMMMIVGKKVEELIARIAQKARAAGIHLVLATQRPSVDVITGLIKANIPTRMAFQVSSKIDSRTILDQQGAENLLGQGDMLYLPPGSGVPTRVHGAFVDDHEVHAVVNDWKQRGEPNYIDEILNGEPSEETLLPGESMEGEDSEMDEFYDQAVAFVIETRRASVSGVQRKFRIGYNRAARIVEQMQMAGIVSAPGHNGNREVLAPQAGREE